MERHSRPDMRELQDNITPWVYVQISDLPRSIDRTQRPQNAIRIKQEDWDEQGDDNEREDEEPILIVDSRSNLDELHPGAENLPQSPQPDIQLPKSEMPEATTEEEIEAEQPSATSVPLNDNQPTP